jgi:hypothetical protein
MQCVFAVKYRDAVISNSWKDLSKGIYFVEVSNGKQKALKKIVKE